MSIFPTKILLATYGSAAVAFVARIAAEVAEKTGSELHVVYVRQRRTVYPGDFAGPEVMEHHKQRDLRILTEEAQGVLEDLVREVEASGIRVAQAYLRFGKPGQEIVVLADELGAGLVIIGSRGRGRIRRALADDVSETVISHTHCPVLVVRQGIPRAAANLIYGRTQI